MLDAKELADMFYENGISFNADPEEAREISDNLLLSAMLESEKHCAVLLDEAINESFPEIVQQIKKSMSGVLTTEKHLGGDYFPLTLSCSISITLAQAQLGALVLKLVHEQAAAYVKKHGEEIFTNAADYVADMENEHDYA